MNVVYCTWPKVVENSVVGVDVALLGILASDESGAYEHLIQYLHNQVEGEEQFYRKPLA